MTGASVNPAAVLAALSGVVAIALLLRLAGPRDEAPKLRPVNPEDLRPTWEGIALSEYDELAAIETNGFVWLPVAHGIRRVPLASYADLDDDGGPRAFARTEMTVGQVLSFMLPGNSRDPAPGRHLHPGDFTAARVARGAPGLDPWRLETLGREGELAVYEFEIREAAQAAFAMLERHKVLRRPLDEHGRPLPMNPGDFEEAWLRWERTHHDLAFPTDPRPGPPDEWR